MRTTERQEARALMQWALLNPICKDHLIHIPNGGSRNKLEAHNLKLEGVRKGVSDYFLAYPSKGVPGLWIELKTQLGKVSKEQQEWMVRMVTAGYAAAICYGWASAKTLIEGYLYSVLPEDLPHKASLGTVMRSKSDGQLYAWTDSGWIFYSYWLREHDDFYFKMRLPD